MLPRGDPAPAGGGRRRPASPSARGAPRLPSGLRTVQATRDLDVASAVLSRSYAELTVRLPPSAQGFGMRLESLALPDVELAVLDLSSAQLRTVPYPTYTACFPVQGRVRATAGGRSVTVAGHQGVAACPASGEVAVDYLSDDCRVMTMTVGREALERELEVLLGRSPGGAIRFDFGLDVGQCGSLNRSLAFVREELADPGSLPGRGVGLHRLSRLLMAGMLAGPHHQWSEELARPGGFEGPRAIRLALAAIEEHPMAFATVADVARVANLSARALEAGFRRHVGRSPMAHVRRVRLARAHDELAAAEPGSITAPAVAGHWGFTHYGRFSAEYRRHYGCSPRDTLWSARRPAQDREDRGR